MTQAYSTPRHHTLDGEIYFLSKKLTLAHIPIAIGALFIVALSSLLPRSAHAQAAGSQAVAVSTAANLPLLGDGSEMSSNEERRLGDRIVRELYRDPDYFDDAILGDYVQDIWQPLLAAARLRGDLSAELDERFAWQVLLGRDRTVNAFALPGGYLGLNLGLLAVVSSRDELASVLGHELSHVTQRHISRLMTKNAQQTPWLIGAMILGAMAASKGNSAGEALMVGGQALSAQAQLNFSRDMEREADRIGFGVMTQAGFDAAGFVSMFDKLQQAARHNDSGAYPYLRSHPLTTERIADMHSRLPLGSPHGTAPVPTALHAMMVARARVLANSGVDALRTWQAQVNDAAFASQPSATQAGLLYGAAMAANRLRDPALSKRNVERLQTMVHHDESARQKAHWLGIEMALAASGGLNAGGWLQSLQSTPSPAIHAAQANPPRAALFLAAQLALHGTQPAALEAAAVGLQTRVAAHPQDASAWQWLARIYGAQNQPLRALRAQAEERVAQLDYAGALDRLTSAQEQNSSRTVRADNAGHIDASIIDTRKRQVEALLKEQSLDR
ncbi:MAG: M48 family metalloprotease [Rhodoferax sp.]|jgi:predicted Zn-dependent protease|uniref:M48 family metalloprotease n=1 Tax=Rhodoferax sp. TaxID=50421 RepID=UPI001B472D24|nr:M48 family metalloprotease [Rhodoferax sp.]MBP9149197.1 M48 family metalloprotease [Rhodoferax sp.]MBP9735382.1 M48 family metalloprotease [Rhodoferax sp.]